MALARTFALPTRNSSLLFAAGQRRAPHERSICAYAWSLNSKHGSSVTEERSQVQYAGFNESHIGMRTKPTTTMFPKRMFATKVDESQRPRRESSFRNRVLKQNMDFKDGLPCIIIAGAAGQIGAKVLDRLLHTTAAEYMDLHLSGRPVDAMYDSQGGIPSRFRIILMDNRPRPKHLEIEDSRGHEIEYIQCDFNKFDASWADHFSDAYVAFLLATKLKFPNATDDTVFDSLTIKANLLEACARGKVERVVFGSSTDVMRGKMQNAVNKTGGLTTSSVPDIEESDEPEIANPQVVAGAELDSRLYAAAKAATEAQVRAMVAAGTLNKVIILRMGAVHAQEDSLPGEEAKQLLHEACKGTHIHSDDFLLEWFKHAHLTDEDLNRIVDCCVTPGLDSLPEKKVIYVNAVSPTSGTRFKIGMNDLGYVPPSETEHQLPMSEAPNLADRI